MNNVNPHKIILIEDHHQAIFGLSPAQFKLKYQTQEPIQPHGHYLLARVYENKKEFLKAIAEYREALQLGLNTPALYLKLLRLAKYSTQKKEITQDVGMKFKGLKRNFLKTQKPYLLKYAKMKKIKIIEKQIALITLLISSNLRRVPRIEKGNPAITQEERSLWI